MDGDTNDQPQEQEGQQADVSIDLRMENDQLQINIAGPDDRLFNQAVHFAHWVGRNLPALVTLALADLNAQRQILDQARAIEQLAAPAPTGPVIAEPPVPRLVSADGKLLQ